MDKLKISDADTPFIHALREVIRTGVVAAPNLESSPLIDLPIVHRESGESATPARRAFVFIKILQQVIHQRLQGKEAETANILFGFEGYAGVPIQDRYRAVAKLYNPHWTWENYRKEHLTRHLLTVYFTLKREFEIANDVAVLDGHPREARSGLVGQDWLLEEFDGSYILPTGIGQKLEAIQTRRLRALCSSIDTYRHYAYIRERGISSIPQLSLIGPGTATVVDTHVNPSTDLRIYVTEVKFPRPVLYGESIEFTLHKQVDVQYENVIQKSGWDWYGLVTLPSPAVRARIGIKFPSQTYPRSVWRYEDIINGMIRPGKPTDESRLTVDDSGFVSCSWANLSAGYSYGISLDW